MLNRVILYPTLKYIGQEIAIISIRTKCVFVEDTLLLKKVSEENNGIGYNQWHGL
jgi:hypothetical protein